MAEYKDIDLLRKQIKDVKWSFNSTNEDYMTGYLCALLCTEGMIAGLPTADVVEIMRCKDCEHYKPQPTRNNGKTKYCCRSAYVRVNSDDFCSYGERKEEK